MRTQTTIWTTLPNGLTRAGAVRLSVFVSPQLQTDEGGAHPTLSLFPDWTSWPHTVSNPEIRFGVTFAGHGTVDVAPSPALSEPRWEALFDPLQTGVTSYAYEDFSTVPIHSFDAKGVATTVSALYGKLGTTSPIAPPLLTTERGRFEGPPNAPEVGTLLTQLVNIDKGGRTSFGDGVSPIGEVVAYYNRPTLPRFPTPEPFAAAAPTLDFHQAVSSLGSFPAVLRDLGLVFDLVVPLPHGLTSGIVNVSVVPHFTSAFSGAGAAAKHWTNIVVSPATNCRLTKDSFRAIPVGPDYGNGMLDLADTTRFSIIDLDVDGAAQQLSGLASALSNISAWVEPEEEDGQTLAMSVPALRSTGPSVVWSGWANSGTGLNELATRQTNIANAVKSWVTWFLAPEPKGAAPALPLLQAEDIIRGHRFDVLATSEPLATWRSLHQRIGRYVFGTLDPTALPAGDPSGLDEGTSVPGATTAAGIATPPPDLYVNEAIARWAGWSLAAPRPGPQIDPDDTVSENRQNPAVDTPDANGQITPQLSASFTVAPNTLPKLRFGELYRYRARAVDLAGNSVAVTTLDTSTATTPERHFRYEPVASPVMAHTAALGPGEATLLVPILNYQAVPATPIIPNGRWLFPPKSSELLAEEHGMLDGFRAGHPPNPNRRPNPDAATYQMLAGTDGLAGRVDATLGDLPAVQRDPSNGTYFPPTTNPTTPWLPDPLSRGATLDGFPGATAPTIRLWHDGPWPDADPLLLLLRPGLIVGHSYTPGTTNRPATEHITLPPGDVLDLGVSSALTAKALETLGVFAWMEAAATSALERFELEVLAERGQLWMLSPYRVVRFVHAVRLPLVLPSLAHPIVSRAYGSVQANVVDASFVVDEKSTADIDAEAFWTDPLDDPSDPTNDPTTATVTNQGHAFKAHVPDPGPLRATARPMEVFSAPTEFEISEDPGVVHNIGDTLHHLVDYTCTATSRFAEFFRVTTEVTFSGVTPLTVDELGLDPTSVVLSHGATELVQSPDDGVTGDYIVNGPQGTITLVSEVTYSGLELSLTYLPVHSVTGTPFPVEILSSAAPKAPKVAKVTPAWANTGPNGSIGSGLTFSRVGGYIRVYLERPWYSSGAGELLGVVGLDSSQLDGESSLPSDVPSSLVTMMGLDPISVSSLRRAFPVVPDLFGALAPVPSVPYRPAYSSPPSIPLLENPDGPDMQIWPYEVQYDPVSGYWYADVNLAVGSAVDGPPPGYFVRLALVRFQPYSIVGAEVSSVALATFAQPVPDRFVSVTSVASDPTMMSVNVQVSGTGYYGWRPPNTKADATQVDNYNAYAEHPYSPDTGGARATSTMIVEVQVQATSGVLSGDLAWGPAPGLPPVMLNNQQFEGNNEVTWSALASTGAPAQIELPFAIGSTTPMRLRISELDYYPFGGAGATPITPAAVNTTFRRPFVTFIPIN